MPNQSLHRTCANKASSESIVPGPDREELGELVPLTFGDLGGKANDWIDRTEVKAREIVKGNWEKVCLLSNALVDKNVMCGAEAIRIIEMAE